MEENVTNSTETECQRQIGKPGDSQHQSVESQNDNSKQQIKPSNVASLEAMDEDVICIEDEDEETVSSKTDNKTGKRNLHFCLIFLRFPSLEFFIYLHVFSCDASQIALNVFESIFK